MALPMLRVLDFSGYEARVVGADVLRALEHVSGTNLRFNLRLLDLGGCHLLDGTDMAEIMRVVRVSCCDAQTTINVSGCSDQARLCAVADCAQSIFGAASPRALFELLMALQEDASHILYADLCGRILEGSPLHLMLDEEYDPGPEALRNAAANGSAWEVALLLSVAYAVGDEGQTRTFDCNDDDNDEDDEDDERDENRQRPIHFAAARGDEEMIAVLVSARADLNPADDQGNTPLLAAITTGHLELAKVLIDAGADISAANKQGNTPLLAASAGGHLELAKMLVAAGANVKTTRADGAGLLALAIVSQKEAFVNFAFEHGPRRLEGQGTANAGSNIAQLAQLFLDPGEIGRWVRCGASPSGLIGEIGALLCSTDVEQLVQEKLENVRAFINHHSCVLENPALWPVLHFVEQLASQETDCTFRPAPTGTQTSVDLEKTPAIHAFIERVNPRQWRRACRLTMRGGDVMRAVAFSPDGSRLARAEGCLVVVCDARTGFVESTLTGHSGR